jgi:hypothetical protein
MCTLRGNVFTESLPSNGYTFTIFRVWGLMAFTHVRTRLIKFTERPNQECLQKGIPPEFHNLSKGRPPQESNSTKVLCFPIKNQSGIFSLGDFHCLLPSSVMKFRSSLGPGNSFLNVTICATSRFRISKGSPAVYRGILFQMFWWTPQLTVKCKIWPKSRLS